MNKCSRGHLSSVFRAFSQLLSLSRSPCGGEAAFFEHFYATSGARLGSICAAFVVHVSEGRDKRGASRRHNPNSTKSDRFWPMLTPKCKALTIIGHRPTLAEFAHVLGKVGQTCAVFLAFLDPLCGEVLRQGLDRMGRASTRDASGQGHREAQVSVQCRHGGLVQSRAPRRIATRRRRGRTQWRFEQILADT